LSEEAGLHVHRRRGSGRHGDGHRRWGGSRRGKSPLWTHKMTKPSKVTKVLASKLITHVPIALYALLIRIAGHF
jgi:hypothetical protein